VLFEELISNFKRCAFFEKSCKCPCKISSMLTHVYCLSFNFNSFTAFVSLFQLKKKQTKKKREKDIIRPNKRHFSTFWYSLVLLDFSLYKENAGDSDRKNTIGHVWITALSVTETTQKTGACMEKKKTTTKALKEKGVTIVVVLALDI